MNNNKKKARTRIERNVKNGIYDKANKLLCDIAELRGVNVADVVSSSRKAELVLCRQLFCKAAKELYYPSLTTIEIGNIINRDHASVVHSVKVISSDMEIYWYKRRLIEKIISNATA